MTGEPPGGARILLFTGKGGVGKTTIAAATAVRCAELGQRTLVLSTDAAHSLADAFDLPLVGPATPVSERLWAEQLGAEERLEDGWTEIRDWMVALLDWAGADAVEAEELATLPGIDELLALAGIDRRAGDGRWDTVIVDCAPTAETLRLLSLPDVLGPWIDRVFPLGRGVTRVLGPLVRSLSSLPVASGELFDAGERFALRLAGVKDLLSDEGRTRVRLVVVPEKLVIAEARRTATYLSLYGYGVDAVVVNRLLPGTVSDPWFEQWKSLQAGYLGEIEEGFAPLPVLRAELAATEVVGLGALGDLARRLYGDDDPTDAHEGPQPLVIRRVEGGYELTLELPFADREGLDLGRRGDELVVRIGSFRRNLLLPDSLRRRTVSAAMLRDGRLTVRFDDRR
jgi:arsenite-transporting ATPase